MTTCRPFQRRDLGGNGIGLAVGLLYGFMGILCVVLPVEGGWMILLAVLPLPALHIGGVLAVDRSLRKGRSSQPPAPPVSRTRRGPHGRDQRPTYRSPPMMDPRPAPGPAQIWRDPALFLAGMVVSCGSLLGRVLALMIVTGRAIFALPKLAVLPVTGWVIDRFGIRTGDIRAGWPLTAAAHGFGALALGPAVTGGLQP